MTRVDLHLHSRASTKTGNWFLQSAGLPESYTDPEDAYRKAKRRGMGLVTLTDHDTIDGALEIAHHPDVFVSVEATSGFPGENTPLHILCWDVSECDWTEIDRVRGNVFELIELLTERRVTHALAHPLQRIGATLTADHIERCLLLFPIWEGRNGARSRVGNETAVRIAEAATPAFLDKLAEKHGIARRGAGPPALTAGSDDHGLIDAAATWTETPPAHSASTFLAHIRAGRTSLHGAHGSTAALAHAITGLAVKAASERGHCPIPADVRTLASDVLEYPLPASAPGESGDLAQGVRRDRVLRGQWRRLSGMPDGAPRSHARHRLASDWAQRQVLAFALGRASSRTGLGGVADRLALALGAIAITSPYMAAAGYHAAEARFSRRIARDFFGDEAESCGPARAAVFTDTLDDLNGVAGTMRRLATRSPALLLGITVVAFGDTPVDTPGLVRIRPLARLPIPAYRDGSMMLGIPPIAEVIDVLERNRIEVVHAATLGPLGLAGLLAARILGLPFVTSHSTQLARYTLALTGDRLAAEAVRAGSAWVHRQADRVFVPSSFVAKGLENEGLDPDSIRLFGRGVDTDLFTPACRSRFVRRRLGGTGDGVVIITVSRLSREKGIESLIDAVELLEADGMDVRLAIVGDGPLRAELAGRLAGTRHRLLGPLAGPRLATAYASADIFCLPSVTETLGQVALEAQASGLPTVVPADTAIAEQVEHGVTGIHADGDDPRALAAALRVLASDAGTRSAMATRARERMLARPTWDDVFRGLANDYHEVRGGALSPAEPIRTPVEQGVL